MVPFVICRTRNSVSFLHRAEREVDGWWKNKQGFALDEIIQNETVCNFCLKKNVLLFSVKGEKPIFFSWIVKEPFYFPWSRPPFTTLDFVHVVDTHVWAACDWRSQTWANSEQCWMVLFKYIKHILIFTLAPRCFFHRIFHALTHFEWFYLPTFIVMIISESSAYMTFLTIQNLTRD